MRTFRIVLTALIAPPAFLAVLVCATAALAAWLGRGSLRFDVLTHFAPVWFAGGLVAAVGGAFLKGFDRGALVSLGTIAMVAAGGLIVPELIRSTGPKAAADAPGQIKLVQFNVWYHNRDMASVVAWLRKEAPDVAVLEEATPELRRLLQAEPGWHVSGGRSEVVIISKAQPVSSFGRGEFPPTVGPIGGATFRDARGAFTVIGVHYAWPTDAADQQSQERRLAAAIRKYRGERTIVAGDFNSAPWSFSRKRWDREFGLPRRTRALFSWPAAQYNRIRWLGLFPILPIDHVYAGDGWATVSVKRGPKVGSDHYPVIVTLAPRAPS
ncbi:endonuclease/exonuclease/phosphatase family protein [Phenylobacterium sp.]|jgi:endonuclease/exonuclease/phosphatase (EEP) superfamily protein YafD|uniref:endonuclease/exonuclease/phosphatase family protein n=1 Tax=Phenylobacterium sp. TaxID=1871053 RepID=UPI002F95936F